MQNLEVPKTNHYIAKMKDVLKTHQNYESLHKKVFLSPDNLQNNAPNIPPS